MNDYKYTPEKLYEATDNGLAIIHRYLPDSVGCERNKKHFKLRNERTPSATIFKGQECWMIKDFGSGEAFSPIQIFQRETGISDFHEALKTLYSEFNVSENNVFYQPNKEFTDKGDKADDYFFIKVKKKVERPQCFSEFVTAEICERYNVYEVEYYERITNTKKQLMRVNATEYYPIFCYSDDLSKWAKTYCPAEKKREITNDDGTKKTKNYKHGYLGKKEGKYIHGLDFIKKKLGEGTINRIEEIQERLKQPLKDFEKEELKEELSEYQLPYIIICSGGSDGLTVVSLSEDFYPIWCNSEGEMIDVNTYNQLKTWCKHLINLPDMDSSGKKYAYKYSQAFWQLDTVFLPEDMLGGGKDFRDYLSFLRKQGKSKDSITYLFKNLLKVPVSCRFVVENDKKYRVDNENLYHFLNSNDYFVHISDFAVSKGNENKGVLVKLDGFKVSTPTSADIRNFCVDFLRKNDPVRKKIEHIRTCNALRENELKQVPSIQLDFTKHGKDFQLFFFENICVKVTADGAKSASFKENEYFVKADGIIKEQCHLLKERFFEEYKDENGQNRVKILKNDYHFMNFLINGSRVYWKEEHQKDKDFRKKFILNNSVLTEAQQIVQEQHFLSKCFAFGYLLHRYCVADFQKFIYVVDDEMKGGVDAANGGSGKGIFTKALSEITKVHEMPGKDKNLFSDKHKYDGLDETHDVICFNDLSQTDFKNFYNDVTDGIAVNWKNDRKFYIPYHKAPKIVGTFNYGLKNADGSDLRRIFFVTFSSYYHYKSEEFEEWQPRYDFGHRFFTEWTANDRNWFYNFAFRCVELYMKNLETPFEAPMENIEKNNLRATIGDNFLEWADVYFEDEPFDCYLSKNQLLNEYRIAMPKSPITPNGFKKSMQHYCKLRGYVFNPEYAEGYQRDKKRITRFIDGKTQECFYFSKKQESSQETNQVSSSQISSSQGTSTHKKIDTDGIQF
ncbi:hypothetical protein RCZ02_16500 [Capnocytophaga felis]|uniref:hypothetical protein n=1 Tax=Capnocytophaga felis TaxID=2267611 RepID=UPI0012C08A9F|nr:hypothetical protein [Capnocytophaga felis]GET48819.1 hypothetical protein RCZ02_16500 [Capnocytophaga felis]